MEYRLQVKVELYRTVTVTADTLAEASQRARDAARYASWDGEGRGSNYAIVVRTDLLAARVLGKD